MPTLRQLECALAVEKRKHFGRAATDIGITTSGLTQAIQRLEEHYGNQIFIRGREGVSVTHWGQIILDGARGIIEREAATKRQIKLASNLEIGHCEWEQSRSRTGRGYRRLTSGNQKVHS